MISHSKFVKVLIIGFILSLIMSVSVFAADEEKDAITIGTLTGNNVNLRQKASTSSKIIDCLAKGTKMIITSTNEGWYGVTPEGRAGFIYAEYLDADNKGDFNLGSGKVTGSVVNMRDKPNTSGAIVAKLSKNTIIALTGIDNGWFKVKYGKYTGYMTSDYVEMVKTNTSASSAKIMGAVAKEISYNPPDPSKSQVDKVLEYAKQFLGVKYVWGGASPKTGFDCSGFTYYVFKNCGYKITRTNQKALGSPVSYANLKAGDLVFFSNNGTGVGHVGIYVGGGKFIHSPRPGKTVQYTTLAEGYYKSHFLYGRRLIKN